VARLILQDELLRFDRAGANHRRLEAVCDLCPHQRDGNSGDR
jgi:hypothetical protein